MVSVMKSPNIMSTTGRRPVIAAPTAKPVKPASEIGVSSTRSLPNSSTNPERTLKGVPASATSSPRMHTRESRRISSAKASRTACANVNSRCADSGINVLLHFLRLGIRGFQCELHRLVDLAFHFGVNAIKHSRVREILIDQPITHEFYRVAFRLPALLLLLGAVVLAIYIANVMSVVAICVAQQECGPTAPPRALH